MIVGRVREARREGARAGAGLRDVPDVGEVRASRVRRRAAEGGFHARRRRDARRDRASTSRRSSTSRIRTTRPARCYDDADIERIIAAAARASSSSTRRISRSRRKSWMPRACGVRQRRGDAHGVEARPGGHPSRLHGRPRRNGSTKFDKVRPPYNINVLTQAAAELLLDHVDVLDAQAAAIARANARNSRRKSRRCPARRCFRARPISCSCACPMPP